jgi:hypothetical protein
MTISLMLNDSQAQALEQALTTHLREMELELAGTESRPLQRELHYDLNRIAEVLDQLSRRRRFVGSMLGHPVS